MRTFRIAIAVAVAVSLSIVAGASPASADTKNCSDFSTQAEAKAWQESHPNDPSNLNHNSNGVYCENLPPGGPVAAGFGGLADTGGPAHVPTPVIVGLAASGATAAWLAIRRRPSLHRS